MKFKVGDKVVRTALCSEDYTVKQGGEYVISKVDDECNSIYLQGVYDSCGQPDWFNPDNFELVEAASKWKQMSKFKKGDKVRCVSENLAIGVNVGDIYTIKDPLHHKGQYRSWHVALEEVISTPNENVLELYKEYAVKDSSKQTPFEKKGWTENSIFKVVEQQKGVKKLSTLDYTDKSIFKVINAYDSCFEVGDLVVIDSQLGDYDARFKLVSEYGQYRKPFVNWLKFEGLEYVGELGALEKQVKVVVDSVLDIDDTPTQDKKDYNRMSPDVLIPISIDGNDFKVKLGSLVILKKIIGKTNGAYLCEVYNALGSVFDTNYTIRDFNLDTSAVDANSYSDDLFSEYFKPIKEKKELEQKCQDEKKSLQSQIEALQEQLKQLD